MISFDTRICRAFENEIVGTMNDDVENNNKNNNKDNNNNNTKNNKNKTPIIITTSTPTSRRLEISGNLVMAGSLYTNSFPLRSLKAAP